MLLAPWRRRGPWRSTPAMGGGPPRCGPPSAAAERAPSADAEARAAEARDERFVTVALWLDAQAEPLGLRPRRVHERAAGADILEPITNFLDAARFANLHGFLQLLLQPGLFRGTPRLVEMLLRHANFQRGLERGSDLDVVAAFERTQQVFARSELGQRFARAVQRSTRSAMGHCTVEGSLDLAFRSPRDGVPELLISLDKNAISLGFRSRAAAR
mmetsp:Transcript_8945/g.26725  ORF Transcript_8945/g.26725 Transcript_8945/m.26725 type:complete len:215 (+) Transcript_8945:390-1034(+)